MARAAQVERSSTAKVHELALERDQARQALEGATGSLSKTEKESRRQVSEPFWRGCLWRGVR